MGLEKPLCAGYGEFVAIEPGCTGEDMVLASNKVLVSFVADSCAELATFTGAGVGNPELTSWPIGRNVMPPTTTGGKPPCASPDSRVSRSSPCDPETCFS